MWICISHEAHVNMGEKKGISERNAEQTKSTQTIDPNLGSCSELKANNIH